MKTYNINTTVSYTMSYTVEAENITDAFMQIEVGEVVGQLGDYLDGSELIDFDGLEFHNQDLTEQDHKEIAAYEAGEPIDMSKESA